ncbi:MAG: (d)CMP kinase [Phycisphaerales bacterium]|nr:(d)CMP kinase [Phycisphaerales bacterium]
MPVSETSERVAKESPSSTQSTAGFTVPSTKEIIITIDGPAGTGKSTVARMLAQRLGLDFLDTGAMYRAAAAIMIDRGYTEDEIGELVSAVIGADLHFDWSQDPPTILAWDTPIDHRIRSDDVTQRVSFVATIPELRSHMVRKQRVIFAQHPRLVTEGRDQGSIAFPDAPVKFYLDADPKVRAERRIDQLGLNGDVSVDEMCERILERDRIDSSRSDGPLVCPDDAIVIDTSELSIDGVIDEMERVVRDRLDDL